MYALLKTLVLPPASLIVLALAGVALARRSRRWGLRLTTAALVLLYLTATPLVSSLCLSLLEAPYEDPLQHPEAEAIVLLAGGSAGMAPEYGAHTVNAMTMARLRYAAKLQRESGKPLLVSGGAVREGRPPEAQQIRSMLEKEMGVPVRWTEERSVDTFTNALESRRILAPLGITRIHLVTHAWHMPRARLAFEHAGFVVIPAPTGFTTPQPQELALVDFLPSAPALVKSYYFWHEVLGYAAYRIRAGWSALSGSNE